MPRGRKKAGRPAKTATKKQEPRKTESRQSIPQRFSGLSWNESYTSLFLGALVVVIVAIVVFAFLQNRNKAGETTQETSSEQSQMQDKDAQGMPAKAGEEYVVAEGDWLSSISEKAYGTQDNWKYIAAENDIQNPDAIEKGTKLRIPNLDDKKKAELDKKMESMSMQPSTFGQMMTDSNYVVKEGESLWSIAVKVYGDGYRWPEIAKVNNLWYPDWITAGTTIVLPK